MADYKRPLSSIDGAVMDSHDKKHSKPGRKPIESEPKSKRTAQNRAAQRAYRERKEKKMKDLEDQVKSLEDRNIQANTEVDFLKAQVSMLKNELARFRGGDVGDLSNNYTTSTNPEVNSSLASMSDLSATTASFPWSKQSLALYTSKDVSEADAVNVPQRSSTSSSITSPHEVRNTPQSDTSSAPTSVNLSHSASSLPTSEYNLVGKFEEETNPFCASLSEACGTKDKPVPKYLRKSVSSNGSGISTLSSQILHGVNMNLTEGGEKNQSNSNSSATSNTTNSNNSPFANLVTPSSEILDYNNEPFFNGSNSEFSFVFSPDQALGSNTGTSNVGKFTPNASVDPLLFLQEDNFDVALAFDNIPETTTNNVDILTKNDTTTATNAELSAQVDATVDDVVRSITSGDKQSGFDQNDTSFNDVAYSYNNPPTNTTATSGNTPGTIRDDTDPLKMLVTEDSIYDPLSDVNVNFNFNEFVKSSLPSEKSPEDYGLRPELSPNVASYLPEGKTSTDAREAPAVEDDDVVPAPQPTYRCAEIWDRITSHPRYTELDIDSLCDELKVKAKCSDKGVVINASEVNQLIEKSAIPKK